MSSYLALARKYRPQEFDDVIGQSHITTTLKNAIATGRISHAYLFCGPRGIGKTSIARIFAKALNCKTGPAIKPCNKCTACVEITRGASLDVLEIDGASNRGIDEIRNLRENVKFSPSSGKFKIYIIDEVHMLTTEAFNALLKTLEEPPAHVKFIFATTQPQKILATILSRCQRFDFRRLSVLEIVAKLKQILKDENITIEEEALYTIARSAEGSMRDAESITDQIISYTRGKIQNKDVTQALGLVSYEALLEITQQIIDKNAQNCILLVDKLVKDGKDITVYAKELIEHFRALLVAKTGADIKTLIELPQDLLEKIKKQSQSLGLDEILYIISVLTSGYEQMRRTGMPRVILEILTIRLSQRENILNIPEIFKKLEAIQQNNPGDEHKTKEKIKESHIEAQPKEIHHQKDEKPEFTLDKIHAVWGELMSVVKKKKMSIGSYLGEAKATGIKGDTVIIAFPAECAFHKESMEHKHNAKIVEDTLTEILGQKAKITLVISKDLKVAKPEPVAQATEETVDPIIKSALDIFGGKIINKG